MNWLNIDRALFLAINSFVGKVAVLDSLMRLIVNEYFVPVSLALIVLYLWFAPGKNRQTQRKTLPLAALSVGLVDLIITFSNQFIIRERPFQELATKLLFYKPTDPSFPSNSAAVGFAIATAIFIANKKLGIVAIILAGAYGFSRIYAGVHYPSDVVVGSVLGTFCVLLVSRFKNLIKKSTELIQKLQTKTNLDINS